MDWFRRVHERMVPFGIHSFIAYLMRTTSFAMWVMMLTVMTLAACGDRSAEREQPNVVILFLDDSGWADFNPFTDDPYPTPNVNALAEEGCCFDQFYVPQAICSASRAALMTGCYPGRTKVFGAHGPGRPGLDTAYHTLGELLQANGYTTGIFGKWHIGDQTHTRPDQRGFDESSGLMYSNDMWPFHPEFPENYPALPYWENGEVTIDSVTPAEQEMLTQWATGDAVDFIARHHADPFFLYVPYSMPHVPVFCSERFEGKSGQGLYADVITELDWSVGKILGALEEHGVEENTLVVFTSDNGPWTYYGNRAGTTPFREAKATSFDGGTRSACIIRYPGEIEAGTRSDRAFGSIDLLPVICELTGTPLPSYEIDGKNVWDLITRKAGAENPHEYYAFSTRRDFEAIMSGDGKWKMHLPHEYRIIEEPGKDGMPGTYGHRETGLALYDLESDPYEQKNVIEARPDVKQRLLRLARKHHDRFYGHKPFPVAE